MGSRANFAGRLEVMSALSRAGLAAARTEDPGAIYASVTDSLREAGFWVSIYAVDAGIARMVRSSFSPSVVRVVERRTGLRQDSFQVPVAEVPFFQRVIASPDALLFDTGDALGELFPAGVKWLAGPVSRVMKIRRLIGARVLDEAQQPIGLLFLLGNELDEADLPTASVFAQLLSVTLGRARMMEQRTRHLAELEATQAQLLQAQKLDAIGRLTGGIAHDFNNLLTPALFAVGDLEQPSLPAPEHRESVAVIRQALERSADLTRSLLAFGRRQMLTRRTLVLDDAVGGALRLVRASFQDRVRLEWLPGAGNGSVNADVTQLHQVLINLALNARDAMVDGGVFRVSTRVVAPDWLELECRDTGVGMTPEVLARIFEPFFTTKGPANGTGLGLSVVEGIVRQHGGTIDITSRPGEGTTVRVRFQAVQAQVEAEAPPVGASPANGRRLLVVEDEPLVRRTLVRVLTSAGYHVTEAASLEASRQLRASEAAFELVITDVVLPDGKSTDETVALARAGQKVLFVSGHPLDANWLPVELERLPVLQKPFGPSELLAAVRRALR